MALLKALTSFKKYSSQGTYIVVTSPHKIPHIALVSEGKYYSLTHKKSIIGEAFAPYLTAMKRAKKPLIFIKIKQLTYDPKKTFSQFLKAAPNGTTCLVPVKNTLFNQSEAEFLYALVPELYEADQILTVFHLNMDDYLDENGNFELNEYSKQDIYDYIESLNRKYA